MATTIADRVNRFFQSPSRTKPDLLFLIPLVGIGISESVLFYNQLDIALWVHSLTLLFCTLVPLRFPADTEILGAIGLVPLFRLINLGMPVFFQLTAFWFPLIYGPMIPALYLFAKRQSSATPTISLSGKNLGLLSLSLPLALFLAEIEFSILEPAALIPAWSPTQMLMLSVVMIIFVGTVEELLFRGVLQQVLQDRLGRWGGLTTTSAVFGLMHSGYGVLAEIAFAAGVGLLLGALYDRTDSLAFISLTHGLLNVFLFGVLPYQGSILGIG